MSACNHAKQIGYVSNQPDGYDRSRPHASTMTCDRPACIAAAKAWVEKVTKEPAIFSAFKKAAA